MPRRIHILLALLAVVATLVMFISSGEPTISFLRGTSLEAPLLLLGHPNTIAFNLSVGYLVSGMFWLLVVYFPERTRQGLLRENLSRSYLSFKQASIQILLWSSIGTHDSELPITLCDHRKFQEFFKANDREHWYAALNGLQSNELRMHELVLELEIFADELGYVLSTAKIQDAKVHELFKLLKENIYRLNRSSTYSHDQAEYVGRFLWEVLAHWSFVDGYKDRDMIQDAIEHL